MSRGLQRSDARSLGFFEIVKPLLLRRDFVDFEETVCENLC
jgi:hypothetical protein